MHKIGVLRGSRDDGTSEKKRNVHGAILGYRCHSWASEKYAATVEGLYIISVQIYGDTMGSTPDPVKAEN